MKSGNKGIALILFAILFQLCSSGMDIFSLLIGVIGLIVAFTEKS